MENKEVNKVLRLLQMAYLLFFLLAIFGLFVILSHLNPSWFVFKEKKQTTWRPKSIETDLPDNEKGRLIRYGYDLIVNTAELIGPFATDQQMAYSGNKLTCGNCHLQAGRKIGSGSFIGVTNRFPQFRGRENKMGTIEDRINGCMERSMNGKKLDPSSREMQAMVAYMQWLSESVPEDMQALYKGYLTINIPESRADTVRGRLLYETKCMVCHQQDGRGTLNPDQQIKGYLYPPVAGPDSFNDGAGMNRVITAAEFIKGNMPFGATYDAPMLSDEEAYHIAAYINSLDRPSKSNKEADFPDRKLKPVSTPYGPWADEFSPDQHKYGPFQPIMAFYRDRYGLSKTK